LNARLWIAPLCSVKTASLNPVMWLQSTMRPSEPPEHTVLLPSEQQVMALTLQSWIW
jgi:hypothetical protein